MLTPDTAVELVTRRFDWVGVGTRFVLVTGKGGGGKTTVASATAVASADFVHGVGRIYLEDSTYSAMAQAGAVITKDEPVRIVGREQASFIVKELDS